VIIRKSVLAASLLGTLLIPQVAVAQDASPQLAITTPYPGVAVDPGLTARFDLTITGPVGTRADLSVAGLPDGWTVAFRAGASTVTQVAVSPTPTADPLRLDVTVPNDAADGDYDLEVTADTGSARAVLPVHVTIATGAGGSVTLTPDFPGQRGPSGTTYRFQVQVDNGMGEEVQLQLDTTGPQGWQVNAEPSGQSQASVITVDPAGMKSVALVVDSPANAQAGLYEVGLSASDGSIQADTTVQIQIIGQPALTLSTPDQRLNAAVQAGTAMEFPIVVVNSGTAPLSAVALSATPPRQWTVDFAPAEIPALAPGESATVTATITPSTAAIAGDYDIGFSASADLATDSMNIRANVNPSGVWGLIGVGLIALTFAALAIVFRQFGRR
jgi:uncharacterized membrane protein